MVDTFKYDTKNRGDEGVRITLEYIKLKNLYKKRVKGQQNGLADKVLATKTDNLNLIHNSHLVEKENQLPQVVI